MPVIDQITAADSFGAVNATMTVTDMIHAAIELVGYNFQEILFGGTPTSGTYRLSITIPEGTETTRAIPLNAAPTEIQQSLTDLDFISAAITVSVTGEAGIHYFIKFTTDIPPIRPTASFTGGSSPTAQIVAGPNADSIYLNILGSPSGGTFTLGMMINGVISTTSALPYNVSLSVLQSALLGLPNYVSTLKINVTGTPGQQYLLSFSGVIPTLVATSSLVDGVASIFVPRINVDIPGGVSDNVLAVLTPVIEVSMTLADGFLGQDYAIGAPASVAFPWQTFQIGIR